MARNLTPGWEVPGTDSGQSSACVERAASAKAPLCRAFVTRPTGFEPVTFGSVDRRSIQLSYGREPAPSIAAVLGRVAERSERRGRDSNPRWDVNPILA